MVRISFSTAVTELGHLTSFALSSSNLFTIPLQHSPCQKVHRRSGPLRGRSLPTPVAVAGVFTDVCLPVFPHNISKTNASMITRLDTEMIHHNSWKPIYFGSKVKGQGYKVQKQCQCGFLHSSECPLLQVPFVVLFELFCSEINFCYFSPSAEL